MATFLYGTGDGRVLDNGSGLGTTDVTRTDFELLGRYTLHGSKFYLLAGFRYIDFELESKFGSYRETSKVDVKGAELGFGFSQEITKDGRHQAFGNLLGLLAISSLDYKDTAGGNESTSGFTPGVDVNVGYQFWITPSINVNARYRVFVYSYENEATFAGVTSTFRDIALFHGPEFGASFSF